MKEKDFLEKKLYFRYIFFQIICKYCGSAGLHVKCGNLPLKDDTTWKCSFCTEIIKKMPPRAKHNFRKIHLMKKSSQCKVLAHLLTKSHISISASASSHIKPEVHQITGSSSTDRKSISVSYSTEQINLSSNLSSSLLSASVRVCPKFEIPKPVMLGARSEEKQTIHEKIVQEKACLQPILKIPKVEVFPDDDKHMIENNVPLSVIEVIEDVIRKYSLEHHSELKFKKKKTFL